MQMKKVNAAKLDSIYNAGKEKEPDQQITGAGDFPKYDIYETVAGKRPGTK